jgi:hypothetical protein
VNVAVAVAVEVAVAVGVNVAVAVAVGVNVAVEVGVKVAVAVAVAVAVGVDVDVGVGVGDAQGAKEPVSAWPVATGGLVPPVVSQPYCVNVVSFCFSPTTIWLSSAIVAGVMEL